MTPFRPVSRTQVLLFSFFNKRHCSQRDAATVFVSIRSGGLGKRNPIPLLLWIPIVIKGFQLMKH